MTQVYFNFAVLIINFLLGLFVLSKNWRSITNRTFALFAWIISFWIFNVSLLQTRPSLFQGLLTIGSGFLLGIVFFLFARFFPDKGDEKLSIRSYIFIIVPITLFLLAARYQLVLKDVIIEEGKAPQPVFGPAFPLLAIYGTLLSFYGISLFYKKFRASSGIAKLQLKYSFLGFSLFIGATVISSVILPALGIIQFSFSSPAFSLLFIGFTTLAILRYHLFEVQVILTELLVGLMGLVLAGEIFLFKTLQTRIFGLGVFFLFCIFGYLLVRVTHQEIKRKEELQKAYQELKKLDVAKTAFISIASHQLRTPLTVIKGYISMILEGSYGKIAERAKKPMESVFKSNERLIRLVNDLLTVSKVETGKIEVMFEKASLEDLISELVNELKIRAKKKNLYMKFEKPREALPKILIDKEKIRQVILNILDNAIRYTQHGGITVKVEIPNSKIQIAISDTGEGMTKEEASRLFVSFARGSAGIRLWTEGVGLGLYVGKKYIDLHKGKIWVESSGKGKGSTFFIELPMK